MLLLKNKVDTKEWLEKTCEVEGEENKELILNSELLSTFGDWNLDYFYFIEKEGGEALAYCASGIIKSKRLLLCFQVEKESRNKKIGEQFLKEIVEHYKKEENKKYKYLELSTRNENMKKIAKKNGFRFVFSEENDFLKTGVKDDVFKLDI